MLVQRPCAVFHSSILTPCLEEKCSLPGCALPHRVFQHGHGADAPHHPQGERRGARPLPGHVHQLSTRHPHGRRIVQYVRVDEADPAPRHGHQGQGRLGGVTSWPAGFGRRWLEELGYMSLCKARSSPHPSRQRYSEPVCTRTVWRRLEAVLTGRNGPGCVRTVANRAGTALTGAVRTGR